MKCPNCAAEIAGTPVEPGSRTYVCEYCSGRFERPRARVRQAVRRVLHLPSPPVGAAAPSTASRGLGCIISLILFIILIASIALPVLFFDTGAPGSWFRNKFVGWEFPIHCNGTVLLEGVVHKSSDGPLITADNNCRLTLRDSELSGTVIIDGKVNVTLVIERSKLNATSTAIELGVNPDVTIKSSEIAGPIILGTNPKLKLYGAKITSTPTAVTLGHNARVRSDNDTRIESKATALAAEHNAKIQLGKSALIGELSLDVGMNGKVDMSDTTLIGPCKRGRRSQITPPCPALSTE